MQKISSCNAFSAGLWARVGSGGVGWDFKLDKFKQEAIKRIEKEGLELRNQNDKEAERFQADSRVPALSCLSSSRGGLASTCLSNHFAERETTFICSSKKCWTAQRGVRQKWWILIN